MSKEITVKQFLLKKFPTDVYMDCPIPKEYWPIMQEYAEAYHKSTADPSTEQSTSSWQSVGDKDKFLDEVRGNDESYVDFKKSITKIFFDSNNYDYKGHPYTHELIGKIMKEYTSIVNSIGELKTELSKPVSAENIFKELWYKRNPVHETNSDTGEDMFWGTAELIAREYASIVNNKNNSVSDSIEFAEWIGEQSRICFLGPDNIRRWYKLIGGTPLTTQELYKIFQESQPQQKEV